MTYLLSCEEDKCCYKLIKCTKWHLFYSKWSKMSFWVKIVVILSVSQLVLTVIFFSAWDKSRIKWDISKNSIRKMRTLVQQWGEYMKDPESNPFPPSVLNNTVFNYTKYIKKDMTTFLETQTISTRNTNETYWSDLGIKVNISPVVEF